MTSIRLIAYRGVLVAAVLAVLLSAAVIQAAPRGGGKVVVADRASGTISVISTRTDELIGTYPLPQEAEDNPPEPMYVFYSPIHRRVFVGDRANDRVVAFDARTFDVDGWADAGQGVFHMWGCRATGELWVNNDIDNTTSIIDMRTLETVATVDTPADLVADGGKPHDVIVDGPGFFAYVSVLGLAGMEDAVAQYDARTYELLGYALVGKDPHLSLANGKPYLYVPAQNSNVVSVLDRRDLSFITDIDIPGAHGVGMRTNGRYLYTTNLTGGGTDALYVIDTRSNTVAGDPVDAPYAVPHNIALTPNGRKLYVTHSGGASDKVTVFTTSRFSPVPSYSTEVTVGFNPFGIAYVP